MTDIVRAGLRRWLTTVPDQIVSGDRIPDDVRRQIIALALESSWSCRRGSWLCASPTSKSTLSRRLRSIGC